MEMEARMTAKRETEWLARLVDQQRMAEMFQYMQSLSAAQDFAPPPLLFPPADPTQFHTPVSIKILVPHDIYSSGITHTISSLCRDNLRHPTTLIYCSKACLFIQNFTITLSNYYDRLMHGICIICHSFDFLGATNN
jgi:hypothetical protein